MHSQVLFQWMEEIRSADVIGFLILCLLLLLLVKYGVNIIRILLETFRENPMLIVLGLILLGLILWIVL